MAAPCAKADPASADKIALANRFLDLTNFEQNVYAALDQRAKLLPQFQDLFSFVRSNLDIQKLRAESLQIVVDLYTEDELKAEMDFYSTPIGQSILAKQGQFRAALAPIVQSDITRLMSKYHPSGPSARPASPGATAPVQHG